MCGSDHPGEFKEKGDAAVSLGEKAAAKSFQAKSLGIVALWFQLASYMCQQESQMKHPLTFVSISMAEKRL